MLGEHAPQLPKILLLVNFDNEEVGRSRYAEESPAAAPRIILHLHPLVTEGLDFAIFREDKPA